MATKSGKRFQQMRKAEIEASKANAPKPPTPEQEAARRERLAKIQAGWFKLTA